MTDDELNAAVARVEGWIAPEEGSGKHWRHVSSVNVMRGACPPYATDWQWCGPLLARLLTQCWAMEYWFGKDKPFLMIHHDEERTAWGKTPQRAICLAVLAAQGDKP